MPIDDDLLEILACPETRQSLTAADAALLEKLNVEIAAGRLRNRGGEPVTEALEEGLLREDGRILYPIDDGIPIMLIDRSIEIG